MRQWLCEIDQADSGSGQYSLEYAVLLIDHMLLDTVSMLLRSESVLHAARHALLMTYNLYRFDIDQGLPPLLAEPARVLQQGWIQPAHIGVLVGTKVELTTSWSSNVPRGVPRVPGYSCAEDSIPLLAPAQSRYALTASG